MPKAIKRKVVKPPKTEENVKDIFNTSKRFVSERRKVFLPAVSAVLIAAFAVAAFFIYKSNVKSRAADLEYQGYKIYFGLYQKQSAQGEERYRAALEKFKAAYDTRKSPLSLYYIANCYYDMGRYDDAMKSLKDLNERFPDDERFVPLSFYKMAVINEKRGDKEAALKLLDAITLYRTSSFKDLALIESARLLESMGKAQESVGKLQEIIKGYPDSPFAEEARRKIAGTK